MKGHPLRYFPIFVDLDGREVLIVGGGEKALQKLRLLSKSGAHIRLVAAEFNDGIRELAHGVGVTLAGRQFAPSDLSGAALVSAGVTAQPAAACGDPHTT